jgi:glyoxylase-like metal-dependent hydrolase (beta-lactamase superfamily II)
MPGHTDCSAIIHIPDEKIIFAGDLLFAKTFPWAGDPTADPNQWIESFQKILKMDIDTIIPGHGPISGKEEIRIQLEWFKKTLDEMKQLISEGVTREEIITYEGYKEFYESTGDRRERSLSHWYDVLKR